MKKSLFIIAASVLFNSASAQITVNRVVLPAKFPHGKTELILNGGGVRSEFALKVYVLGLYLQTKNKNPKEIINADKPMAVRLQIISNLMTSSNMSRYIREGFGKSTGGKTAPIEKEIKMILTVFNSERVKVGDTFDVYYTPNEGVRAVKNGKPMNFDGKNEPTGSTITGLEFKKALFGIWLSDNPVDDDLKDAILGL